MNTYLIKQATVKLGILDVAAALYAGKKHKDVGGRASKGALITGAIGGSAGAAYSRKVGLSGKASAAVGLGTGLVYSGLYGVGRLISKKKAKPAVA